METDSNQNGETERVRSSPALGASRTEPARQVPVAAEHVAAEWQVGDVLLDLYEVTGVLGEGGMGRVYKVHHRGWNVDLAVKSPRPEIFATAGGKENFVREAETWVNLGLHPHTVSCYYVRTLGGIPRVFAEYVEGGSLADWIRTKKLYEGGPEKALERILDIAIQFAWGLHYAHEQGLVHQDVKPANVMLTADGTAKVTDFGLAKARGAAGEAQAAAGAAATAAAGRSILVSFGGMTPAYCSPEQARGEPLSRKTDIWSWAVSVLEMFTGEVTWLAGQAAPEALEAHVSAAVETALIPPIPDSVVDLLQQCFEVGPASRPPDMESVARCLFETYTRRFGTYARPDPQAAQLTPDAHNNRALSYLDIGKDAEARAEWKAALTADPQHVAAIYNQGVYRWRHAELNDEDLRRQLEAARTTHTEDWRDEYALALVELERGDLETAASLLGDVVRQGGAIEGAGDLLKLIQSGAIPSCREIRSFRGHRELVHAIAVSDDAGLALTAASEDGMRLWDVATGRCLRELDDTDTVAIGLAGDGRRAISGNEDGTIRLWDTQSGQCLHTFEISEDDNGLQAVCLSADGRFALSAAANDLRLWDVATGRCVKTFAGHTGLVEAVCLSSDSRWALSGSFDNTVRLWDVEDGKCVRIFEGHQAPVYSVCISADSRSALSAGSDSTIRLWNLATGRCLRVFHSLREGRPCEPYEEPIDSVSWSRDGKWILSGGKNVKLWEAETGRCLRTLREHKQYGLVAQISADARSALVTAEDNTVGVWELPTGGGFRGPLQLSRVAAVEAVSEIGKRARSLLQQAETALDARRFVDALACLEEARELPGYERAPETLHLWRRLSRHSVRVDLRGAWPGKTLGTGEVHACCVSRDGRFALCGGEDRTLEIWDLTGYRRVRALEGHEAAIQAVSLSGDGRVALSAGNDQSVRVWETENGKCLRVLKGHTDRVTAASISADGVFALSSGWDKSVRLWRISTGEHVVFSGHSAEVDAVALSPDGSLALSGSRDRTLRLWDTRNGACLRTFEGHEGAVVSIDVRPDLAWALTAGGDNALRVWELATGRCLRVFRGHTSYVMSVCLSGDGRFAVSGSHDRTLRIWKVDSGQCLQSLEGHEWPIRTVALSPDGRWALSGGKDKGLRLWELDWVLDAENEAHWHEGAQPYVESFLACHTPILTSTVRSGKPAWTDQDFQALLDTLASAGYGWLRPEGVRKKLLKLSSSPQKLTPKPVEERSSSKTTGLWGSVKKLFGN